MITGRLEDMFRGWVIGDFEPSLLKTQDFEVAILLHKKAEEWPAHYHKIATEYNILLSGTMSVCGKELVEGDTFTILPNEVAAPVFHEDCRIVCIKVPSLPDDKYLV
jgi:quercetin dioxygenase-like cupin family protein